MRLIDADRLLKGKEDHDMISTHVIWNAPTINAVPVEFIESEIKWMDKELDMMFDNDADDGEIDRMLARKTALEVMLGRWMEEEHE